MKVNQNIVQHTWFVMLGELRPGRLRRMRGDGGAAGGDGAAGAGGSQERKFSEGDDLF